MSSGASNTDYLALKDEGNALYAAGDFPGAICKYNKGLEFCANSKADLAVLLKNRAAAYLKLGDYQKVVDDTTAVLDATPSDAKALYHRCQAYEQLGKYSEAFEDARAVNRINPENSTIQPYLMRLQKIVEDFNNSSGINALPVEVILKIFGYFDHNQLARIAKICKRWNVLVKCPVLWQKVNVELFCRPYGQNAVTKSFIDGAPPCVTDLGLNFNYRGKRSGSLSFPEISVKLQEKFSCLKMLMFYQVKMSDTVPLVIDLCTQFLQTLRVLVFCSCVFPDFPARAELAEASKIEILHMSGCKGLKLASLGPYNKPPFSRMPHLHRLCLAHTRAFESFFEEDASVLNHLQVLELAQFDFGTRVFQAIQKWGHNLKELFLCGMEELKNSDLVFDNSVFPQAETFCLRRCNKITAEGVVSLIKSCPTLQKIYVRQEVAASFALHPFVSKNEHILEIVKTDNICFLYHKADYIFKWELLY